MQGTLPVGIVIGTAALTGGKFFMSMSIICLASNKGVLTVLQLFTLMKSHHREENKCQVC